MVSFSGFFYERWLGIKGRGSSELEVSSNKLAFLPYFCFSPPLITTKSRHISSVIADRLSIFFHQPSARSLAL